MTYVDSIISASTLTDTAVTIGTAATLILAANDSRKGLAIQCFSSGTFVYVGGPTVSTLGFPLDYQMVYVDSGVGVLTNAIYGMVSSADVTATVRAIETA